MEIRSEHVSYSYPDGTKALEDVSFSIETGELVALMGQNGAGKTTLVRHFIGLYLPTRGDVWIGSWNTHSKPVAFLARHTGYAYQNPDDQLFCKTIWEEVSFGPKNLKKSANELKKLVEEAIFLTGLQGKEGNNPFDLSWDLRRRVAVASILAMDTDVVILDEPTAGQDLDGIHIMKGIIRHCHETGKTVVVISHDIDFCADNFDRALILKDGELVFDGKMTDLFFENELLDRNGLHLPVMQQLGNAMNFEKPIRGDEDFLEAIKQERQRLKEGKL